MVCVTCVLIEQLVPVRPQKKLKRTQTQTSPDGNGLPLVVLRGCFAAKKRRKINFKSCGNNQDKKNPAEH